MQSLENQFNLSWIRECRVINQQRPFRVAVKERRAKAKTNNPKAKTKIQRQIEMIEQFLASVNQEGI